jgi:hypothetical protein
MNTHKQTLFRAILARISRGAVPMDGVYWFDPKDARLPMSASRDARAKSSDEVQRNPHEYCSDRAPATR